MKSQGRTIDLLCKVVDNYGDIGVVWRLARAIREARPDIRLRLLVDDLTTFNAINPAVDPGKGAQELDGMMLFPWATPREEFRTETPRLVVEAFACGRPQWYEDILFDSAEPEPRLIVNLEHLSAESYARELHRMDSLTRSPLVKKRIFMPGFGAGTGGLILDRSFIEAADRFRNPAGRESERVELLKRISSFASGLSPITPSAVRQGRTSENERSPNAIDPSTEMSPYFWVLVFSYEHNYSRIIEDLAAFNQEHPLVALLAAGRSRACFMDAWDRAGAPFKTLLLPFLPQGLWDEVILACDFSIVRGEDSLSRAALSGRPFLWQAYLQEGRHQLVKVEAFLDRLRPLLPAEGFAVLSGLYRSFNDRDKDDGQDGEADDLLPLLMKYQELEPGFREFTEELLALGNLATNLVTFMADFV